MWRPFRSATLSRNFHEQLNAYWPLASFFPSLAPSPLFLSHTLTLLSLISNISHFQIDDAILSNASESLTVGSCVIDANTYTTPLSVASVDHQSTCSTPFIHDTGETKQKIRIPTAIVRPKYQKPAFDDRQLPIIARMDRNQPWYDRQCAGTENSTINTKSKKPIQSNECERKVKKRSKPHQHKTEKSAHHTDADDCSHSNMISVRSRSECGTTKEKSNSLNAFEKDTNSRKCADRKTSSVAIVQPRRKEKMDERKLMETIVQMQIKKNSVDNRNNNQRNGTRNAPPSTVKSSTSIAKESPKDASGTVSIELTSF